jgi:hypothetical protein
MVSYAGSTAVNTNSFIIDDQFIINHRQQQEASKATNAGAMPAGHNLGDLDVIHEVSSKEI